MNLAPFLPMNKTFSRDVTPVSRRRFLETSAVLLGTASLPRAFAAGAAPVAEPIIDMHQHVQYSGRADDVLIGHQRTLGATTSVLMPSGDRGDNHPGGSGEHEAVLALCKAHPGEFVFFANELTDHPDAPKIIERQLPMLLHFQDGMYNRHIERFHIVLEKFPTVKFIGHATAWWAAIDKNYKPGTNYPKGIVTPGGITDRLLTDYPNCYAEVSAGSGNGAIVRDEEHYRGFIARHVDKLMFGSDCSEGTGRGPTCFAARTLAANRKLSANKAVERKILYENAKKMLKL